MYISLRIGALVLAIICVAIAAYLFGPIAPVLALISLLAIGSIRMATKSGRRPWMHTGLPVLVGILFVPAIALAASIDVGQALSGSLVDVVNAAIAGAITTLLGWLAVVAKNKFNIDIEAKHRDALRLFLQRQASSLVAAGAVKVQGVKIEVGSAALAAGANTALAAIPNALNWFGLTPAKIEQMIVDLLPTQPAIAQAQAVALDVANPATPSKPAT